MRPACSGSLADCQPSCSGRGTAVAPDFRSSSRRGLRPTRQVAFSSSSYALSADQTTPEPSVPLRPPMPPVPPSGSRSLDLLLNRRRQSDRDAEGRSLAGRKKSLKINLDLALYRARQTRIEAQRASDPATRSKMTRDAEEALRRCMAMDPEDGRAYVSLGKIMVQQRRFEEALELYEAGSAATGGTNAHIWTAWAYLAWRRGDLALGRRLYDAAVVASPTHAAAYHGWGLLEKSEGNVAKARDLWSRGIQATADKPNPYLFQSLAVLAADLGRPEEARKWFRAGTRTLVGAASHAMWQAWAVMEQKNGTDEKVVRELYRRALQYSPRSRYTFLSWGVWEKEQGHIGEARKLFQRGAWLNPRDAAIVQAWALMEESLGDLEQARKLFRRASKADPQHLYVWQAWGCMEQRAGCLDAARELFQQGIWTAPPRARAAALVFQAWGVLERDAGNAELARELFKCAVKSDPCSEPSWLAWADMEETLGGYERAQQLRSFNMQERQEVVVPANFTTLPPEKRAGIMSPLFDQLAKWFQRYEEAGPPPGLFSSTDSEFEL